MARKILGTILGMAALTFMLGLSMPRLDACCCYGDEGQLICSGEKCSGNGETCNCSGPADPGCKET